MIFLMTMHTVYFSLGANIGDREATMLKAIEQMEKQIGTVERRSAFYVTEPWGFESENSFINAALCCSTGLSPRAVLECTQRIERELGRTSKSVDGNYHDRPIDIDILLYDDITVDEPDLKIPHPLMYEREFVMTPLKEILER